MPTVFKKTNMWGGEYLVNGKQEVKENTWLKFLMAIAMFTCFGVNLVLPAFAPNLLIPCILIGVLGFMFGIKNLLYLKQRGDN